MSRIDDDFREALRRSLDDIAPVAAGQLDAVRRRHGRGRRNRRLLAAAAAVAVVALGSGVAVQVLGSDHGDDVVHQSEFPRPLRVVRSFPAASLGLQEPERVAAAPNGDLYVTDSSSQTVTEVNRQGAVVRRWGAPGSEPGQFRLADGGIAVGTDGRVYVADSGNGRVQVFEADGTFVTQLGGFGDGAAEFEWPWAIAVASDGSVYVSDDRAATLTKLSADGHQDWRLGGPDSPEIVQGHDHFGGFDSQGRLVVANDDSGFVLYLDSDGRVVDQLGTGASGDHEHTTGHPAALDFPDGACDTTVGPDDTVYVTGCVTRPGLLVQSYDAAHTMTGRWPDSPLVTAPRFAPDGTAAAIGADGSVLVLTATTS